MKHRLIFAGTLLSCLAFYGACSSDEPPSSSSPTITAPTPQSPAVGATVSSTSPTLTVGNASGASGLRYRFEVASDSSFGSVVASGDNLPEGGTGTTSWQVSPELGIGETYYWRARASLEGTQGPYSPAANFEVEGGFASSTPVGSTLVYDPLTNGTSVGEVGRGRFDLGEGWVATDSRTYIRYDIPTTPNGFVEFQVKGLRNPNPLTEKRNLLIMWDPSRGEYTENPFRVHIAKYDTILVNRWQMRLRFISNGQETNTGINLFDWDPQRVYTFRLEWGAFPQVVSSQRARVLLDGAEIMARNYDPIYRPTQHVVELGMAPRGESLEGVTYSNVTIGVRRP